MAIGTRISSNNLVGKTGSVTFLPVSGGTINLGTKTLPFNYLTEYPYGEYQILINDYNYTYSLTIPLPAPQQSAYTNTVNITYTGATLVEKWGSYTVNFLASEGYPVTTGTNVNDIVYAEGICSDDVDAPSFPGIQNIGNFPSTMNVFLGPFMSGGLAGFPFVGTAGLNAWASHVTSGGTLFISSTPHIGISFSGGVGEIYRKGQAFPSSTCGAVRGAIDTVTGLTSAPQISSYSGSNDYEFYKLLEIVWPFKSTLTGQTSGQQMVTATSAITQNARDFIYNNLNAIVSAHTINDVYFCSGNFINTDYGYQAYAQIDEFLKLTPNITGGTWVDLTSTYLSGLTSYVY
jgi:hypothetical protein